MKYPCFVMAPQCRPNKRWVEVHWGDKKSTPMQQEAGTQLKVAIAALDEVLKQEAIDRSRIYLTGLSMGGYIAFEFVKRYAARVRGLMLLNTRAERDGEDPRRQRDEMIATVRRDGVTFLGDLMLHRLFARGSLEAMPQLARPGEPRPTLESSRWGGRLSGVVSLIPAEHRPK